MWGTHVYQSAHGGQRPTSKVVSAIRLGLSSEYRAPPASALLAGVTGKCYTITYMGLMHVSKHFTLVSPLSLGKIISLISHRYILFWFLYDPN